MAPIISDERLLNFLDEMLPQMPPEQIERYFDGQMDKETADALEAYTLEDRHAYHQILAALLSRLAENRPVVASAISFLKTAADAEAQRPPTIVEAFTGEIVEIADGVARLRLREDREGGLYLLEYDAAPLAAQGIGAGDRLRCRLERRERTTRVVFEKIVWVPPTPEQRSAIAQEIETKFADFPGVVDGGT